MSHCFLDLALFILSIKISYDLHSSVLGNFLNVILNLHSEPTYSVLVFIVTGLFPGPMISVSLPARSFWINVLLGVYSWILAVTLLLDTISSFLLATFSKALGYGVLGPSPFQNPCQGQHPQSPTIPGGFGQCQLHLIETGKLVLTTSSS